MRARLPLIMMASAVSMQLLATACAPASDGASAATPSTSHYVATMVGRIDSEEEARQLVAAVPGVIDGVAVRRGDTVQRGDRLFSVACGAVTAAIAVRRAEAAQAAAAAGTVAAGARSEEIDQAAAALTQAQTLAADAQDQLNRAQSLVDRGFVSAREITARRHSVAASDAAVAGASAQLAQLHHGARPTEIADARWRAVAANAAIASARAAADQCVSYSPIDGTVLQILRNVGEDSGAAQGLPVMVVGDLSRLQVRAEVNERDAARLRAGQLVDVWIDGDARRWSGRVVSLAAVMGRRSARSLDPSDRFDRDMREAHVAVGGTTLPALVGLRVMVGVRR